jgi:hypothetical protein
MVVFNVNKLQGHVDEFEAVAFCVFRGGKATGSASSVQDRRVRAWFGCSLLVLAKTWVLLCRKFHPLPERATKEKFLWAVIQAMTLRRSMHLVLVALMRGLFAIVLGGLLPIVVSAFCSLKPL